MLDEITCLFPNYNGGTVKFANSYIPHSTEHEITYLVKGTPVRVNLPPAGSLHVHWNNHMNSPMPV